MRDMAASDMSSFEALTMQLFAAEAEEGVGYIRLDATNVKGPSRWTEVKCTS